tara:strand:+ start:2551 stop:2832 length:282 start_codon:yes stop_codon:yes gene_type:complete
MCRLIVNYFAKATYSLLKGEFMPPKTKKKIKVAAARKTPRPEIQSFVCSVDNEIDSLNKKCKASRSTPLGRPSNLGRQWFGCECGMTFTAKVA